MRVQLQRFLSLSVWFAVTMLAASSIRPVHAETTPDRATLSPEAKAYVTRTLEFIDRMNGIYFDAAARLNGVDNRLEHSELDTEFGHWDTQVARGPVMEKAGRTITVIKKPTFQADTLWSRYLVLWLGEDPYIAARRKGRIDRGAMAAGQSSAVIHDLAPAAEIVTQLVEETEAAIARLVPA